MHKRTIRAALASPGRGWWARKRAAALACVGVGLVAGWGTTAWAAPAVDLAVKDDDPPQGDATDAEVDPAPSGAEVSGSAQLSLGTKASKRGKRCHSKPFNILDCLPDGHTVEIGLHSGLFFLGRNHSLYDAGVAPQPEIRKTNANLGGRLLYLPIPYVGVGFEATVMPTRSPSERVSATMFTARGHVAGQGPWRITPTFVMGGGVVGVRSGRPLLDSNEPFFYYGPGGKFYVNDWIAVRVEGRHLVSPRGNDGNRVHSGEIFAAVDVTLRVGPWAERRRQRRRKDRDGDGYLDADDRCPDLYAEDAMGCPEGVDTDGDGVPDARDRCPDQWGDGPRGCVVADADGDGILDSRDGCVDEAEVYNGYADEDGCPDDEPEEVKRMRGVIEGIVFASGKAKIQRESRSVLDEVARTLEKFPTIRLKITGHTDNTGSRQTNTKLSARRAAAVQAYLVAQGIDASRLETAGVGPDQPIADNKTGAGRALNRRIEFQRLDSAR